MYLLVHYLEHTTQSLTLHKPSNPQHTSSNCKTVTLHISSLFVDLMIYFDVAPINKYPGLISFKIY
jgi:hypothetical protein